MSESVSKSKSVFGSRNFNLVFFGALVSELGAMLYSFAVSFYILKISGNNAFLQGLYLAVCSIAMLIFTPVGGVLGDRFSKAKIMYICDYFKGGSIVLATVLMLIFPAESAQIVILFSLGIIGNIISGIFNPASTALIPHIVEPEQLQKANSYFTIKGALINILGVVLAGILYAALPIHTLFFLVGASFLASGFSEMLIRCPHTPPKDQLTLKTAVRDMGEGLQYLKTQRAILALLVSTLFVNFFFMPISSNFIPYFTRTDIAGAPSYLLDHILTPELWSSMTGIFVGIGSLLGAAMLSARKQAEKCGHTVSIQLCEISGMLIGLTFCYWLLVNQGHGLNLFLLIFCLGCFAIGYLISCVNISINTALMRAVDKDKLSKVSSIMSFGSQGMTPIASVLAGAVLQSLGSTALLVFCSVGFTITAFVTLLNKSIHEL